MPELKLDNMRGDEDFNELAVTPIGLIRAGVNVVKLPFDIASMFDPRDREVDNWRDGHYSNKPHHRARSAYHQPNHLKHK